MFIDFFYQLRHRGLKVSISEWLTLQEALIKGFAHQSSTSFYFLCRAIVVKKESSFDLYDQVFAEYFKGATFPKKVYSEVLKWLENPLPPGKQHSPLDLRNQPKYDLDKLRKEFEKRLQEQTERHDGGSKWVGTGGTSPFGHSGYHPGGLRIGGHSTSRSASQIASERKFRNLRTDAVLETRQIGLALKKLRKWHQVGSGNELDLTETIDKTSRNGGEIEVVLAPSRKSIVKIILFMDVGGSMTPYAQLCERLFSAAHQAKHIKQLDFFYFHNCPYEFVFTDMERATTVPTAQLLQKYDTSWHFIFVGDAAMHPWELTAVGGSIDYFHQNEKPGLQWIHDIRQHFPKSVWLNPQPVEDWKIPSNHLIRQVVPDMFPMTITGIEKAMESLMQ